MNDQEKSVMLAKAMTDVGWNWSTDGIPIFMLDLKESRLLGGIVQSPLAEIEMYVFDLYDPANMSLAKRAIQWGVNDVPGFSAWLLFLNRAYLILLDDDGFRQALDKLLKLAIESGLVEAQDG